MSLGWVQTVREAIEDCFRRHPAFFFGISFLAGVLLSFSSKEIWLYQVLVYAFVLPFLSPKRSSLAVLLALAALLSTSLRVSVPEIPDTQGTLVAEVIDRRLVTIHDKTSWRVDLAVHEFQSSQGVLLAKGIDIHTFAPLPCPVVGGKIYEIHGTLLADPSMEARFRPDWSTVRQRGATFSFVEWRVNARKALEKIFTFLFPNQDERVVAGALTFGLYKDPFLQHLMHRAGVEHVLAISGFHFGIVAALTLLFLQGARSRFRACIAFLFLTFYLIAVGPLPSVLRSWWAGTVVLLGMFLGKSTSGLNCLGVGLIAATLLDPISLTQVGCQLSFLATAAILLYSTHTQEWCSLIIRPKKKEEFVGFSFADQALTTILHRLFPAFSLIIPVWTVLIPYQLAFMPDMSLLGIIYNLCIPLLYSLAMPCILLAVILYPIPLLPKVLAFIGSIPLKCGMFLVQSAPESSLTSISAGHFPPLMAYIIIIAFFLCGIVLEGMRATQRTEVWKACL